MAEELTFAEKCRYWREQGMQVTPTASPAARRGGTPRDKSSSNSWERGIAHDERGVPILMPGTIEPMPIKHFTQHRHEVEAGIRQNRASDSKD